MFIGLVPGAAVIGGGFYFIRRYVRAIERRSGGDVQLNDLVRRIAALEDATDSTRRDIERLEVGQEFTTRLLGNRSGPGERPR